MAASASAEAFRDDHALAGGQSVGLDDDGRAACADIGLGRCGVAETLIGCGRYAVGAAEVLGEAFGAFELRGGAARPEGLDAGRFQIVHDAGAERRFRADDDEVDAVAAAKRDHRRMVGDIEGDAFGFVGDSGIAGAQNSRSVSGLAAIFQASACSRPPEPRSRMFMVPEMSCRSPCSMGGRRRKITPDIVQWNVQRTLIRALPLCL